MSILNPSPLELIIPLRPGRQVRITVPANFSHQDLDRLDEVLRVMFPPIAEVAPPPAEEESA